MGVRMLKEKIANSINSFIRDIFQPNPFDFLYEADIQSAMWSRLKNDIDVNVKWEIEDEEIIRKIGKKSIQTSIIKTQYPNGPKRFDIAIIHPESKRLIGKKDRLETFWVQPILLAIELKYLQYGFLPNKIWEEFSRDIELLKTFEDRFEYGLALLFVQSAYLFEKLVHLNLKPADIELSSGVIGYVVTQQEIYQVKM
jgi:hypothetical protein